MTPTLPPSVSLRRRWLFPLFLLACSLAVSSLQAASYYVDPATGSMSNPGTSASPWSTLQAVFAANKVFVAGDVIYLRAGYHGIPAVKGLNAGIVTIQPDGAAVPLLSRLTFVSAKNWVVSGLDICPENAGAGTYSKSQLVSVDGNSSYVTLQNSNIRSANSIDGWTQQNWYDRAASGYSTSAPYSTFYNCQVTNTDFSIVVNLSANHSLVSHNTVTNFYGDAMRGLADFSTFEYNTVMNSFIADSNHDDCFQGWSTGSDGVVGDGVIYNVTIRNNLLMSRTDPNQPLYNSPQGISNFDGFSENWVIENNVIFCSTYHGIALYGATNCQVLNNTVLPNPLDAGGITPWILITEHKAQADGTAWPVKSSGNLLRNNISARGQSFPASEGTTDHNIVTTAYSTYFRDYPNFDVGLLPTSPAVNAGSDTGAPSTDFADHARTSPYDIGAYEYLARLYEPFNYAAVSHVSSAPDSPSDSGFLGTTWSGNDPIISPGLTYGGLTTLGNALQFTSNVGAVRSIDMQSLPMSSEVVDSDGVTRLGADGSEIWLRFLIREDVPDVSGTGTGALNLDGANSGGIVKLSIGDTGTSPNWSVSHSVVADSGVPIVQGQVALLVVRIQFAAGKNTDRVDLYVNPPLGPTPPATPSASLINTSIGTFDRIEFKGTRTTTVDELSLSTTWSGL